MFRYALIGMAGLLAGSALAQQAPVQGQTAQASSTTLVPAKAVTAMEQPLPGDFWTYETRDEITGKVSGTRNNVVTEVTATEISTRFELVGTSNQGLNVYDRSWNLKSSGPWKYQPNDGSGIQSPLKVGTSWRFQADEVNAGNGNIVKRSGNSKVVSQEAITTRAGTFDTFKIETVLSRRPTNDPTRREEIMGQTWYAPAIDHWVKRTVVARMDNHLRVNNTIELVEYGRKQQ
jgi:hypothetical protein